MHLIKESEAATDLALSLFLQTPEPCSAPGRNRAYKRLSLLYTLFI
jgi:hypothetical protein